MLSSWLYESNSISSSRHALGVVVCALGQGKGARTAIGPRGGRLGPVGTKKFKRLGNILRVPVLLLDVLRLQQCARGIGRLAALCDERQSHHALEGALLLLLIRRFVVRIELFFQLEARLWEGDGGRQLAEPGRFARIPP